MTIYEYDPDEDPEDYDWDSEYWPIIEIDRIENKYDDDDLTNTMAGWLMDLSLTHVIDNIELDDDGYLQIIVVRTPDGQTNITPDVIQTIIDDLKTKKEDN